jgi:AcrR family transcriptional regulator
MATAQRQLMPREERRASILAAAARAFAHEGYAATSMDHVASEAGVTKLIVYRHFESKEELYRAVLEGVSTRMRQEFLRAMNSEPRGNPTGAMLKVAREEPAAVRLFFVHAVREPEFVDVVLAHRQAAIDVADAILGESMPDPVVKAWAAETIVTYLSAGVLGWLDHGDPERDDEFVRLATDGLVALYLTWVGPPDDRS